MNMSRHGENIRKRKDGRWEGRYKIVSNDGKSKYHSVYGKTYGEVKEKMSCPIAPAESHPNITEKTFQEIAELWYCSISIKVKGATLHKYSYLLSNHILPILGNIKLSQINSEILNNFVSNKMANGSLNKGKGLSHSYVRNIMLIIEGILKFANESGIYSFPYIKINKPSVKKQELQILSFDEQKKLEAAISNDLTPTTIGILITLYAGLRIGEVCALSWDNLDLDNRIIHVKNTVARVNNDDDIKKSILIIDEPKTESSKRDIPISDYLLCQLIKAKHERRSDYVASVKSGFVSPRTFEYRYHKFTDSLNMPSLNYHALRHTFATRCIECGMDVKTLSEILGHSNVSITLNTYVHSSMELKRQQINKLTNSNAS